MLPKPYTNKKALKAYEELKKNNFNLKNKNGVDCIAIEIIRQPYLDSYYPTDDTSTRKIDIHNSVLDYPIPVSLDSNSYGRADFDYRPYLHSIGKVVSVARSKINDNIILQSWITHALPFIIEYKGVSVLSVVKEDLLSACLKLLGPMSEIYGEYIMIDTKYLLFSTEGSQISYVKLLALYLDFYLTDKKIPTSFISNISFLDTDQPKDEKIWSVYSDNFDIGELNSYKLTHKEAIEMCFKAYSKEDGSKFTICVSEPTKKKTVVVI